MSLSKSPFILLATWGINMSYTPPNPQPPQHERCSSVPLEKTGYVQWVPFIIRVSSYSEDIQQEKKNLLNDPRIDHTNRCLRRWNINYPRIFKPFITAIQINIVAARLERWKAWKPSHIEWRCNRIDFNIIGDMDKVDDLPSPWTIIQIRGQYSGGSRAYCLWSILCRSSSKLYRPDFGIWWMLTLESE